MEQNGEGGQHAAAAAAVNGHGDGIQDGQQHGAGEGGAPSAAPAERVIEIPLLSQELLVINLSELSDDSPAEISELFRTERTAVRYWIAVLDEYNRRGRTDIATQLGERAIEAFQERDDRESLVPLHCILASYAIRESRSAPKTVIPSPRQYTVKTEPKAAFFQRAITHITSAEAIDPQNGFVLDTKANIYLLMGRFDEAFRIYEHILSKCPQHLFALMGKARILYVRRQFRAALKLYQSVLSVAPDFLPDPCIGIGLCFWNLGEHSLARKAWSRSTIKNPGKPSSGASLLLGLSYINAARNPRLDEEERADTYSEGIQYIQQAWASDKTCAATAASLSGYFLVSSTKWDTVIKLAELAVQHGDARAVISEGQLAIARALHAQNKPEEATRHYLLAAEANPDQIVATLGVGQMYMQKKDFPSAINTFENILRKQPHCVEALACLAALQARSALTASAALQAASSANDTPSSERSKAKELYDQLVTLFQAKAGSSNTPGGLDPLGPRLQQLARDPDLYIEIARLWTGEDLSKALNAYRQSLSVRLDFAENEETEQRGQLTHSEAKVPPQLLCNIGSLEYARQQFDSAQERFEEAIRLDLERQRAGESASGHSNEGDAVMMTLMYNLGIVMEARGQKEEAIQLYEQRLLARHPEFIEAKARLAALALADRQHERCIDFLKAALTAQPGHLDLRALYVYFLVEIGNYAAAKDFAVMTLKDFNKTDVYAMCAMAHLLYQQARENKDPKPDAAKDRISRFFRACEAFDRVLQLDPHCLFAAQGVAIALAENNLGAQATTAAGGNPALQASHQKARNLRDALSILAKVRESANDGNVYVNIGLCHFMREEFDRAIESLETANNRFYHNKHLPTLLYLARAKFHKANKDQSFATLQDALQAASVASELAPQDDSIRFNISLIRQRGLELLQGLPAQKRRLAEIQTAIADAEKAQESFAELALNKNTNVTYSTDLADQRRRYGEGLIKRAAQTVQEQEDWEQNEQNKVEMARRDREAERARQAEEERRKREEERRRAEELAAQRRQMIEDSKSWYQKPIEPESDDEEKPKKGKGRKKKEDDGIVPDGEGEEKVDKPKKRKKAAGEPKRGKKKGQSDSAPGAVSRSDGPANESEGGQADEDDEDAVKRPSKRKKQQQFRTPAMIEDSDEDE